MANTGDGKRSNAPVRSLRELQRDIAPPRDLWPAIAAQIAADRADGAVGAFSSTRWRPSKGQWFALAAVVASLAVGVWLGHMLALSGSTPTPAQMAASGKPPLVPAAFVNDAQYIHQRNELLRDLEAMLAELPPETRNKVSASLESVHKSMAEIQAALGRDPGNALLQELLVNTYQDEMRVLTIVQQSQSRQEI